MAHFGCRVNHVKCLYHCACKTCVFLISIWRELQPCSFNLGCAPGDYYLLSVDLITQQIWKMLKLGISLNTPVDVNPWYLRHAYFTCLLAHHKVMKRFCMHTHASYTHTYVHTDNKIFILPHNKGLRSPYYILTEIRQFDIQRTMHRDIFL